MRTRSELRDIYKRGLLAAINEAPPMNPYVTDTDRRFWLAGFQRIGFDEFFKGERFINEVRRDAKPNLGFSRVGLKNT